MYEVDMYITYVYGIQHAKHTENNTVDVRTKSDFNMKSFQKNIVVDCVICSLFRFHANNKQIYQSLYSVSHSHTVFSFRWLFFIFFFLFCTFLISLIFLLAQKIQRYIKHFRIFSVFFFFHFIFPFWYSNVAWISSIK